MGFEDAIGNINSIVGFSDFLARELLELRELSSGKCELTFGGSELTFVGVSNENGVELYVGTEGDTMKEVAEKGATGLMVIESTTLEITGWPLLSGIDNLIL